MFDNCSLRGLEEENSVGDFDGQFVGSRPGKLIKDDFAL
jgi:hypothetical protein